MGKRFKSDSASGYKNFTTWFMHAPEQGQAQKARKRLEHDQIAWDTAVQANSIVGYANYLKPRSTANSVLMHRARVAV